MGERKVGACKEVVAKGLIILLANFLNYIVLGGTIYLEFMTGGPGAEIEVKCFSKAITLNSYCYASIASTSILTSPPFCPYFSIACIVDCLQQYIQHAVRVSLNFLRPRGLRQRCLVHSQNTIRQYILKLQNEKEPHWTLTNPGL